MLFDIAPLRLAIEAKNFDAFLDAVTQLVTGNVSVITSDFPELIKLLIEGAKEFSGSLVVYDLLQQLSKLHNDEALQAWLFNCRWHDLCETQFAPETTHPYYIANCFPSHAGARAILSNSYAAQREWQQAAFDNLSRLEQRADPFLISTPYNCGFGWLLNCLLELGFLIERSFLPVFEPLADTEKYMVCRNPPGSYHGHIAQAHRSLYFFDKQRWGYHISRHAHPDYARGKKFLAMLRNPVHAIESGYYWSGFDKKMSFLNYARIATPKWNQYIEKLYLYDDIGIIWFEDYKHNDEAALRACLSYLGLTGISERAIASALFYSSSDWQRELEETTKKMNIATHPDELQRVYIRDKNAEKPPDFAVAAELITASTSTLLEGLKQFNVCHSPLAADTGSSNPSPPAAEKWPKRLLNHLLFRRSS